MVRFIRFSLFSVFRHSFLSFFFGGGALDLIAFCICKTYGPKVQTVT